jgi:hypothetical protein
VNEIAALTAAAAAAVPAGARNIILITTTVEAAVRAEAQAHVHRAIATRNKKNFIVPFFCAA